MKQVEAKQLGIDEGRLARVSAAIKADVARKFYDGAVIVVGRGGHVALHQAIGFSDREAGRAAHLDDVFHIFSVTKALTGACVLARIDRGELALTTRVAEVIPEFGV